MPASRRSMRPCPEAAMALPSGRVFYTQKRHVWNGNWSLDHRQQQPCVLRNGYITAATANAPLPLERWRGAASRNRFRRLAQNRRLDGEARRQARGRHCVRSEILRRVAEVASAAPGSTRRRRLLLGFLLLSVSRRAEIAGRSALQRRCWT